MHLYVIGAEKFHEGRISSKKFKGEKKKFRKPSLD